MKSVIAIAICTFVGFLLGFSVVISNDMLYKSEMQTFSGTFQYNPGVWMIACAAFAVLMAVRKHLTKMIRPALVGSLVGIPVGIAAPGLYYNNLEFLITGPLFAVMIAALIITSFSAPMKAKIKKT